jgi:MTH538 TIR-like domain (DUF1863)
MESQPSRDAKFDLFISYASADDASTLAGVRVRVRVVHELKRALEEHVHPDAKGRGKGRLRVCTDKEDFEMHGLVESAIRARLDEARAMLVVCSAAAVESKYIRGEIALFKELHPGREPLSVFWDLLPEHAFPEHFLPGTLGANVAFKPEMTLKAWRAQLRNESHKIAARVWEVELERVHDRWREERRASRRRTVGALVATVAILLSVIGPLFWAYRRNQAVDTAAGRLVSGVGQDRTNIPDGEWSLIWDLAANRDDAVRHRFLGLVLSSPQAARRFNNRAAMLTHAAVGLDLRRRQRALDLLVLPTIGRQNTDSEVLMACVRIGVALDERRLEFATRAAEVIRRNIGDADGRKIAEDLEIFRAIEPVLGTEDKRSTAKAFADRVETIMAGPGYPGLNLSQREASIVVVRTIEKHLSPQAVSKLSAAFVDRILDELPQFASLTRTEALSKALEEMADKLDAASADREAERVVTMSRMRENARMPLPLTLRAFSRRQDGPGLDRAARRLIQIFRDSKIELDGPSANSLCELFRDLAALLAPGIRALADDLLAAVNESPYSRRPVLADAFLSIADGLGPAEAEAFAATFSDHFIFDLERLSEASVSRTYASVTRRLAPGDRDRMVGKLVAAMRSAKSGTLFERAWTVFEAGATTMGDREAAKLATEILIAIPGMDRSSAISHQLKAFVVLVQRAGDEDGRIAIAMEQAIAAAPPPQLAAVGEAIRDARARLNAARVKALARAIAVRALDGEALKVTAPLLDGEGAADVAGRIIQALTGKDDPHRRDGISEGVTFRDGNAVRAEDGETLRRIRLLDSLRVLASQLDGVIATRAIEPIKATLAACQTPEGLDILVATFSTLAKKLDGVAVQEVASVAIRRALVITSNLDKMSSWYSGEPTQLAKSIRTLGPLVEAKTAADVAHQAVKKIFEAKDIEQLASLVEIVRALAGRIAPDAAKQFVVPTAVLLVARMCKSDGNLRPASVSLEDLAASFDTQMAAEVAVCLVEAPFDPKNHEAQANLDRSFRVVANRLDAQACGDIARRLQGQVGAAGEGRLKMLAAAFRALAPRLDAKQAGTIKASFLTKVSDLARAATPDKLLILSEAFASLAHFPEVTTSQDGARGIADRIAEIFPKQKTGSPQWDDLPEMMRRLVPWLDPERTQTLKLEVISSTLSRIGRVGDPASLKSAFQAIHDATDGLPSNQRAVAASWVLDSLSDPAQAGSLARRLDDRTKAFSTEESVPVSRLIAVYNSLIDPNDDARLREASAKAADQMIQAASTVDGSTKGLAEVFGALAKKLDHAWATGAAVRIVAGIRAIRGQAHVPDDRTTAGQAPALKGIRRRNTFGPSELEIRAARIDLLVEMFEALSDRVDSAEAARIATSLVVEIPSNFEDPQRFYRDKLIRALDGRMSDAAAGDLAARLIVTISPYNFESQHAAIDAIRGLAAHADAHGSTLIISAMVNMTIKSNRWKDDLAETSARIIDAMPPVLTSQHWVDVLKIPTCLGPIRNACFRQLIRSLKHSFTDVWQMAQWARTEEAGIDLHSFPARPHSVAGLSDNSARFGLNR